MVQYPPFFCVSIIKAIPRTKNVAEMLSLRRVLKGRWRIIWVAEPESAELAAKVFIERIDFPILDSLPEISMKLLVWHNLQLFGRRKVSNIRAGQNKKT
jgi:hypothetical protein